MKHIILGTAGHVDHGKTALIKALTGIDTDRLKEEKERGITIELGFAQLTLNNGQKIGIVDVPGHERFVKNMVAGAGGIDVVALVIAADEGVMPQTREHLDICQLLAIRKGIVALTKTDLVDEEWRGLVKEDIRDFLTGTFLEGCPIVPLSAVTGTGLPEFLSALEKIIAETEERADPGFFRLPIDRVFTMRGFGTVVTGTLLSGSAKVGDTVQIMPQQMKAKIRGIQIHNEAAEGAVSGQRTAMNLQGIGKETIQRGNILSSPNTFESSVRMDVLLQYLPNTGKKLKNRTPVRFHTGTSEIIARIILFDKNEISPGETVYAQVMLESPTIAIGGDRFVIRSYSPINTIGGGRILDPLAKKLKRHTDNTGDQLKGLNSNDITERTKIILERAGLEGISGRHLSVRTGVSLEKQTKILEEMFSKKEALLLDRDELKVVAFSSYGTLQNTIVNTIANYHKRFSLREGYPKEELRITVGEYIDSKLFNRVIRDLEREGMIVVEKENVRQPDHRVHLQGELEHLRDNIGAIYLKAHLTPPSTKEIMARFSEKKKETANVLTVMLTEGILVKINEDMYFHKDAVAALKNDYREFLVKHEKATPSTFRDLTGLSRKYAIPLMEYFDKTKLTIRVEDHRVLRERKENGS
ncbi:MAG: selenocysteine-specific translation elongation factor [Deltaproteobacteria bacterium]|nr:selenocysteine-specific translation elongation factor [Deltaproteobacteria bacterium]